MKIKFGFDIVLIIKSIYLLVFILISISCAENERRSSDIKEYSNDIGDIVFDPKQDSPDFKLCDESNIYHGRSALLYGEGNVRSALKKQFEYQSNFSEFNGYIMIRFLMNCHGETGRFRLYPMHYDFTESTCPESLKDHILELVQQLKGWKHRRSEYADRDYSKYLNFKIKDGKIEAILE